MKIARRKMALRTAEIHARIQPGLKENAERIFEESGHTTSEVLEQFYAQTVKRGKVPIRLTRRRCPAWVEIRRAAQSCPPGILDENVNTPEEIQAALDEALQSVEKQFETGEFITSKEVREYIRKKHGVEI